MRSRDFCYWLQGHFEMDESSGQIDKLSAAQVLKIKRHLAMVFKHDIDPSMGDKDHRKILDSVHSGLADLDVKLNC